MILSQSSLNLAIETNSKIWSDSFQSTRNTTISQVNVYRFDSIGQKNKRLSLRISQWVSLWQTSQLN